MQFTVSYEYPIFTIACSSRKQATSGIAGKAWHAERPFNPALLKLSSQDAEGIAELQALIISTMSL